MSLFEILHMVSIDWLVPMYSLACIWCFYLPYLPTRVVAGKHLFFHKLAIYFSSWLIFHNLRTVQDVRKPGLLRTVNNVSMEIHINMYRKSKWWRNWDPSIFTPTFWHGVLLEIFSLNHYPVPCTIAENKSNWRCHWIEMSSSSRSKHIL